MHDRWKNKIDYVYRQMGRHQQTDRETDRHHTYVHGRKNKHWLPEEPDSRHANREMDKQTDRHKGRYIHRQA